MYACPSLSGKRQNCWCLDARQYGADFLHLLCWCVHQHILLVVSHQYRLYAEQELVQRSLLLRCQFLVAYEQSLALHHYLHLAQFVAYEGRARRNDIKNSVRESYARSNLYRALYHVNVDVDALFLSKLLQYVRVGGSNLLAVKPLHTCVVDSLRYSE